MINGLSHIISHLFLLFSLFPCFAWHVSHFILTYSAPFSFQLSHHALVCFSPLWLPATPWFVSPVSYYPPPSSVFSLCLPFTLCQYLYWICFMGHLVLCLTVIFCLNQLIVCCISNSANHHATMMSSGVRLNSHSCECEREWLFISVSPISHLPHLPMSMLTLHFQHSRGWQPAPCSPIFPMDSQESSPPTVNSYSLYRQSHLDPELTLVAFLSSNSFPGRKLPVPTLAPSLYLPSSVWAKWKC